MAVWYFFLNKAATPEIYTLSLPDALPIWVLALQRSAGNAAVSALLQRQEATKEKTPVTGPADFGVSGGRSEEHTSELQSRQYLVCRLLLEKKIPLLTLLSILLFLPPPLQP